MWNFYVKILEFIDTRNITNNDEISVCDFIKLNIKLIWLLFSCSFLVGILVVWPISSLIMIKDINKNPAVLLGLFILALEIIVISLAYCDDKMRNKNRVKNKFETKIIECYDSIKTKTCFKIKLRD